MMAIDKIRSISLFITSYPKPCDDKRVKLNFEENFKANKSSSFYINTK